MKILKTLLIVLTLCITQIVHGQSKFSEIEKFLNNVVYLSDTKTTMEKINGKEYEIWLKDPLTNNFGPKSYQITGTGFLVYTAVDYYLVTAEHVAKSMTLDSKIVFSSGNSQPIIIKLGDIVFEKKQLQWTVHPNADVAVTRLDASFLEKNSLCCFLSFDYLNPVMEAPFRERNVTAYGYPLSLGIGAKISPITKTSKPSSGLIDLPRFDNSKHSTFYLLDDPSVSGFSGGPVFELPQAIGTGDKSMWVNVYRIVGLVHGSISDKGGGFAAIVPSIYIKETIEDAPGLSATLTFQYEDGKIWSERLYKNGSPWTVISNYDSLGNLQEKGTLKDGTGTLNIYNEKSKLIEIRYYKNGRLIKRVAQK